VFENRVLRRIFGPKRDELTGEWRKLHNEELHNFYSSQNIIKEIKSWGMRWRARKRREECTRYWWENPKERDHSEDQDVDGRMRSEWMLGSFDGRCIVDSAVSG
jgi:hypothetical protein